MKILKFLAFCALLVAVGGNFFVPAGAQMLPPPIDSASADALRAVLGQQKTISDNQAKIDDKLATIAENIRVGRIYSARAK